MSHTRGSDTYTHRTWWRTLVTTLCIILAGLALVGGVVTRYLRDNVLNTDAYVAIVSPLPKNPQVAEALATYTTANVFDANRAEARIAAFLPSELSALAGPLTETLGQKVTSLTKRFIAGDTFNAIWTTANRLAQTGLLRVADSTKGQDRQTARQSLDLRPLLNTVRQLIGRDNTVLGGQQKDKAAALHIDLQQNVQQLRTNVRIVRTGAYVLPYLAIAFLALAIALAYNRRRTTMHIGITLALLGVSMLVVCKIASNHALDTITNATYQAAARVAYEAFYGDLRSRLGFITIGGIFLFAGAFVLGPYSWTRQLIAKIKKTKAYDWAATARKFAATYELWFYLAGAVIVAIWLLALTNLGISTLVVILSVLATYIALVHIVARPAPGGAGS